MIGVHVNWTKPHFDREKRVNGTLLINGKRDIRPYKMSNYLLLCQILSALFWKKYNGEVHLYTDREGFNYYQKLGVHKFYDYVNIDLLENYENVNPEVFWAAGKLYIEKVLPCPFVMLDTDLYLEMNLNEVNYYATPISSTHLEDTYEPYYPSIDKVLSHTKYNFPENFKWDKRAFNVSLLYWGDDKIKNDFIDIAFGYMNNSNPQKVNIDEYHSRIIFAEQKLLGEYIFSNNIPFTTLIKESYNPRGVEKNDEQLWYDYGNGENKDKISKKMLHIWGRKKIFDVNITEREVIEHLFMDLVEINFPLYKNKITSIFEKNKDRGYYITN
jgi:hypothetical protein